MSKKIYFFKGTQYVQYDATGDRIDPGYPRAIADDWTGLKDVGFDHDIDAADVLSAGKIHFFKGAQYVIYNVASSKVESAPAPITSLFKGIPAGFGEAIDAIMTLTVKGAMYTYLFKGDSYIRCGLESMSLDAGYPKTIASGWNNLPPAYHSNLDTALDDTSVRNGKVFFFKGALYARYDILADSWDDGHENPIPKYWHGLDASTGFDNNIQAAVVSDVEKAQQPANGGGGTGGGGERDGTFNLPPNTAFGVTALVNSSAGQTVDVYLDDSTTPAATFKGSGTQDNNLGTQVLKSGLGKVRIVVTANGKASKLGSRQVDIFKAAYFGLVGSEDGTDDDYNDCLVILNWPLG